MSPAGVSPAALYGYARGNQLAAVQVGAFLGMASLDAD